jgi:hypothetical protein
MLSGFCLEGRRYVFDRKSLFWSPVDELGMEWQIHALCGISPVVTGRGEFG